MSHIPERQEKDCLNCGTIVQGHYCHNCGQENVVTKETFWHMVTHFFYDITHFDSSFFHTIHHLILKPGFLSREYMLGRRASYLHPIRMYVFMSAIFFLLFFAFFRPKANFGMDPNAIATQGQRDYYRAVWTEDLKKDTANAEVKRKLARLDDTTRILQREMYEMDGSRGVIQFGRRSYKNMAEYDSIEKTLPPRERDGWLVRRITHRTIELNEKYRHNPEDAGKELLNGILHKLPYMLFVSLPLFALILRLVYIRRRKQFYYADHGVFTIHLYIFTFLWLLVLFSVMLLSSYINWNLFSILILVLSLLPLYYLYRAMLNFYRQNKWKTFLKFLLVAGISIAMMIALIIFFMIFSVFTL